MGRYRINSKFLPTGVVEKTLFETLNMYHRHEDLSNSPLVQWGRRTISQGAWWYGCEKKPSKEWETCILQRQERFLQLYLDIKNNGYNDSIISIYFDDDGSIRTYDGFHRLCIMKYLGMEEILNCHISKRKSDFPLVEALIEINSGRNLYQPCDDERLKGFHVWRPDSHKRLNFVWPNLTGKTVLDIGCSAGFFSRELAKQGYQVTALDTSKKRLAVARYLSTINNLKIDYHQGRWQDYIADKTFDNVLYLSVFHHDILALGPAFGVGEAFKQLERFRGRVKRIFFESPTASRKIAWTPKNKKNLYNFTEEEFKAKIEDATDMTVIETWHGIRPIFLLAA